MPSNKKGGSSSSGGAQDKQNIVVNSAKQAKANEASRNMYKHMSKVSSFLGNLDDYNPTVPEAVAASVPWLLLLLPPLRRLLLQLALALRLPQRLWSTPSTRPATTTSPSTRRCSRRCRRT